MIFWTLGVEQIEEFRCQKIYIYNSSNGSFISLYVCHGIDTVSHSVKSLSNCRSAVYLQSPSALLRSNGEGRLPAQFCGASI